MPDERVNPPPEELHARKWPIFLVAMIGLFMAMIDVTIVNITIPELQRELDAPVDSVSWVLNSYNIAFAVLLVAMGRLADQFGRRRFYLIGITIFTAGSLLCALAPTIDALVAFRVVQAVGAAILAPLALATTALVFPPEQRGLGFALIAMMGSLAAALGPPLGGIVLEFASWPWIFAINVPFGIAGAVLALRLMPESYDLTAGRKVDWWGLTTLGAAIFALTFALVEANERGWGSELIVGLFAGSSLLLGAFAASQRFGRHPLLVPAISRNRQFMGGSAAMLVFSVGVMGMFFLAVLAFVDLWGYTELEAALAISPVALMGIVVSPIVGRNADRVPPRVIAIPALFLMAAGLFLLGSISREPDYLGVLPALLLAGAGIGAMFPAVNVGSMGVITGQEFGAAAGIVNMSRQLGFALGVAILVAVFTAAVDDNLQKAQSQVASVTQTAQVPAERRAQLIEAATIDRTREDPPSEAPRSGAELEARGIVGDAWRDAFGSGFRTAAIFALLSLPFALFLRKRPDQALGAAEV